MIQKITVFFCAFVILLSLNTGLIIQMNTYQKKTAKIRYLLDEITTINSTQNQYSFSAAPLVMNSGDSISSGTKNSDSRVMNLKSFFRKHNSDLYPYAELIVQTSDKYNMDYTLLPAIGMVESNLCRAAPKGSHNCWGWGGTSLIYFQSYDDAIEVVAKTLKKNYIDQGLRTPEEIMQKYNPGSVGGKWADSVNFFLIKLQS
jgi:hypothetical protein